MDNEQHVQVILYFQLVLNKDVVRQFNLPIIKE